MAVRTIGMRVEASSEFDGSNVNGMREHETLVDHHTNLDNSWPIPLREEIAYIGPLPDER